jgi:hypothetical protein
VAWEGRRVRSGSRRGSGGLNVRAEARTYPEVTATARARAKTTARAGCVGVGCARRTVFRCRERYPTLCPETKTGKGWGTRFLGGKGRTARVGGVARGSSRGLRQNLRSLSKAKAGGRMRQFRRIYQAYWSEPSSPPRSGIS